MVRMTTVLCRIPVIKFKKGGLVNTPAASGASGSGVAPGSCPAPRSADEPPSTKPKIPKMLGIIQIPKGVLISGQNKNEVVSMNIVLQKQEVTSNRRK